MENLTNREDSNSGRHGTESINQALRLLDSVAKSQSGEIKQRIASDYKGLKNALINSDGPQDKKDLDYASNLESRYRKLQLKTLVMAKKAGTKVDKSVHENPWYFLGGAAIVGSMLGLLLGNKVNGKRKRS